MSSIINSPLSILNYPLSIPQGLVLMSGNQYQIYGVNGPVVTVKGGRGLAMMDMVNVGDEGLIGEVVGVDGAVSYTHLTLPTT